jgi:hypothetical protein
MKRLLAFTLAILLCAGILYGQPAGNRGTIPIPGKWLFSSTYFSTSGNTVSLLQLKDIVATTPLTVNGGASLNDVLTGADADITFAVGAASTSAAGISELAIASEVNTGTDDTRAVTPDALAGSVMGTKTIILKVVEDGTALPAVGDGKMSVTIPAELNGMNLVSVGAHVYTASDGGTAVNVAIYNATDSQDMLSTNITIDNADKDSKDATTAAAINDTYDDVVTGDEIRIDLDQIGTNAKGLEVRMGFRLP